MSITTIQKDALAELMLVGYNYVRDSLEVFIDQEVDLGIPHLHSWRQHTETEDFFNNLVEAKIASQDTYVIEQDFFGCYSGKGVIAMSNKSAKDLAVLLTEEAPANQLSEDHIDALGEVGNIVINGMVCNLDNSLGSKHDFSLPKCHAKSLASVVTSISSDEDFPILTINAELKIRDRSIDMTIVLVFQQHQTHKLVESLCNKYPIYKA